MKVVVQFDWHFPLARCVLAVLSPHLLGWYIFLEVFLAVKMCLSCFYLSYKWLLTFLTSISGKSVCHNCLAIFRRIFCSQGVLYNAHCDSCFQLTRNDVLTLKVVRFEKKARLFRQARQFKQSLILPHVSPAAAATSFKPRASTGCFYTERIGRLNLRKRGDAQRSICVYDISGRFLTHRYFNRKSLWLSFAYNKPSSRCSIK